MNSTLPGLALPAVFLLTISGCAEKSPEPRPVQAAITGKVIAVKDGDTIVVLKGREEITVRLEGIDCPESGQAFGAKAKQAASDLCFGKQVRLRVTGEDQFGRTLADVILPDGSSLNQQLVRSGHAWWFREYSDDPKLKRIEAEAKKSPMGLWADPQSIAPWDWRASKRAKTDLPPSEIDVVPNGVEIVALLPNPSGQDAEKEQVTIENSTSVVVDLSGWRLIDKGGNVFLLSGRIDPGTRLVVTMTEPTMPMNNNGDMVLLVDSDGVGRSRASYSQSQVRAGVVIQVRE